MRPLIPAAVLVAAVVLVAPMSAAITSSNDTEAPTFYRDVLPVFQANCQTCHRSQGENIGGMIAPMALMTYDEVRPWARSIARAVKARQMPPWFATEATRGHFMHERVLSDAEIDTVVSWVQGGAPAGDQGDAPPPVRFVEEGSGGWSLGKPDLIVPIPEPYFVEDDIEDINISFTTTLTDEQLPEDVFVEAIEFRVGGPDVHHMCASATPPGENPGFGKFSRNSLGCIALGAESQEFPPGYAMKLVKGSRIRFSMHYNKEAGEGSGFWDRSEIGFRFAKQPPEHVVKYDPIGNVSFEIPPGHERWKVGAARVFEKDTHLLTIWPHGHLRTTAARYEAFYPDGRSQVLLDVPEYDQEWQTTYQYKEPRLLPAGTRLEVTMWFTNTPERGAERGFDSEQTVYFGAATTDEMMLGFINYAPAEPEADSGATPPTGAGGER